MRKSPEYYPAPLAFLFALQRRGSDTLSEADYAQIKTGLEAVLKRALARGK